MKLELTSEPTWQISFAFTCAAILRMPGGRCYEVSDAHCQMISQALYTTNNRDEWRQRKFESQPFNKCEITQVKVDNFKEAVANLCKNGTGSKLDVVCSRLLIEV